MYGGEQMVCLGDVQGGGFTIALMLGEFSQGQMRTTDFEARRHSGKGGECFVEMTFGLCQGAGLSNTARVCCAQAVPVRYGVSPAMARSSNMSGTVVSGRMPPCVLTGELPEQRVAVRCSRIVRARTAAGRPAALSSAPSSDCQPGSDGARLSA